ncbi:MAG: choice-of-anchor D domain-containing protein, partial [Sulfurimonas sp.]|nr:choice-of-anchor D domain-containing protein [Sulfurimonas sp.]
MIKKALLVWGVICISAMISVLGSGWISAVQAAVLPQAHDFGPQYINATPAASTFTISNSGTSPLTVQSITLSGNDPGAFNIVPGTCVTLTPTIEPGGNCTVLASFVPAVAGTMSATLDIATDDLAAPLVSASLAGTGVQQYYALNVHLLGDGSGVVHSQPLPDLSCSSGICSQPYAFGTVVSLTAQPDLSSLFAGWNGCDNVSGTVCTVSMNRARDVSVSFNRDMSLANYLWMQAGPNAGTISSLAVSPAFAADRTIFAGTPGGVFRSTSAGASWISVNSGLASLSIRHVAISPGFADDGTVYAATASGLFVSQDGGSAWSPVGNGITSLDMTAVALSPGFVVDQTLYAGTPAGIFRSTDGGGSWSPVTAGIATPSIRAISLSPVYATDGTLVAATTAGVYLSTNRG